MRKVCTFILLLALIAPGAMAAEPGQSLVFSLWESFVGWIAESAGDAVDAPAETYAEESLGLGLEDEAGGSSQTRDAADSDSTDEDPPLPSIGPVIDPYG